MGVTPNLSDNTAFRLYIYCNLFFIVWYRRRSDVLTSTLGGAILSDATEKDNLYMQS